MENNNNNNSNLPLSKDFIYLSIRSNWFKKNPIKVLVKGKHFQVQPGEQYHLSNLQPFTYLRDQWKLTFRTKCTEKNLNLKKV